MSLLAAVPDDGNVSMAPASCSAACGAEQPAPGSDPASAAAPSAAPLVDPTALQDLSVQLESPAVAKGFARDYAKMWDQRYRSLASALERRDEAAALDAVLSVKTSSAMVGGIRLAQLAGELETAIRAGDLEHARSLLGDVAERGGQTMDELQFSYVLRDS